MSEASRRGGSGVVHDALRAMTGGVTEAEVRAHRLKLGVRPVFKRIDSCAAEFDAATPYLYSTYEAPLFGEPEDEAEVSDRSKVMILGGGPNRIGQGIEFDYCCCHAAFALGRDGAGLRDDHGQLQPGDGVDRPRHLRPALFRAADRRGRARDRPAREGEGRAARGDRPARRADAAASSPPSCRRRGCRSSAPRPTASTSPRTASGSPSWSRSSGLKQPANGIARSRDEALQVAERIGYPVLLRPSYVLGGRGMEVVDGPQQLDHYIATAVAVSGISPVLIDRYLRDAIEVDVDAICDGTDVAVARRAPAYRGSRGPFGRQRLRDPAAQPRPTRSSRRSSGRPASWRWRSRSRG